VIASYEGDMPEWPRIAVGLGNQLHVVWFVRDAENLFNSDAGNYQVWYASGATDSPALAPVAVPAIPPPTPVAMALTPVVIPTPTSQIAPVNVEDASQPALSLLTPNLRSENDDVLLLLLSVGPVMAILLLLTTMMLLRRRRSPG
jgi:beta-lactamase regulating signal transducer with metallopeptidase domain